MASLRTVFIWLKTSFGASDNVQSSTGVEWLECMFAPRLNSPPAHSEKQQAAQETEKL